MSLEEIEQNARRWMEQIGDLSGGRCEVCAVSKTHTAEEANACRAAGIRMLGENRVQELREKFPALNPEFELHLIGQLQTNKVKYLPGMVTCVESVDRFELAEALSRCFAARGSALRTLIEVNVTDEPQRGGVPFDQTADLVRKVGILPGLAVRGLMTVLPIADDPEDVRPVCRKMNDLFHRIQDLGLPGVQMETLSMGMTHDCVVAAEEGSTEVRLGSAIFGARQYPPVG